MLNRNVAAIDPQAIEIAKRAVPTDQLLQIIIKTFQTLGDSTRIRILYALKEQSLCVRDLAIIVGKSESAVSHQLKILRDRSLVKTRRDKNTIFYSLDDHHVAVLFREAEYHADHVLQGLPDHPYDG